MEKHGLTPEQAAGNFHIIDHKGLITQAREDLEQNTVAKTVLTESFAVKFARPETEHEGASLADVVKMVKPNVLIGLSTVRDLFTAEIMAFMADNQ
eukprot:scaffold656665_cov52-Prasinocladus_malaysianus.AAC.1